MVEYPDSTYVEYTKNYTFSNDVLTFLAPRVEDMSSVLKIVTNRTLSQQIGLPELNTERIAVFGHSLGGATAVGALLAEPRLEAACNIDGGLWGEEITTNNSRPFMLITAADHPDSDTSWWENWPYQLGRKWHLDIEGAAHNTFTDFSILYKLLGTNMTDPAVEAVMGTIDPIRVFTILRDYIGAFFFDILAGKDDDLLKGPSPDYPDVTFRNMSSGGNQ
ncbi:hypothetical protein B0A52_04568 [Exophiala mesophila]|uniref:1-alkyl-2-acetylglycerophosphocholine esterase n=1 Tax=Exophiala mesophila TaxID=212818 RepID=A0A438N9B3_EXOME|nr:hypothetical protein B0A52_04568 [Exophiala mesophila]